MNTLDYKEKATAYYQDLMAEYEQVGTQREITEMILRKKRQRAILDAEIQALSKLISDMDPPLTVDPNFDLSKVSDFFTGQEQRALEAQLSACKENLKLVQGFVQSTLDKSIASQMG